MILVGSQAMRWHLQSSWAADRLDAIQDWDFICTTNEFKELVVKLMQAGNKICSVEYPDNKAIAKFISLDKKMFVIDASLVDKPGQLQESDKQIYDLLDKRLASTYWLEPLSSNINCVIPCSHLNYVLKLSHKFKKDSPHFEKTRKDILWFEKVMGFNRESLNDFYKNILDLREKLTYNNKLPKLNQSKENFFTDSVPYKYQHDHLHQAVKMLDKPAYEYYIIEDAEVMCSKDKFNALPEIVKLYGVLEESYVLALERSIIPFNTDPAKAFKMSLQKVCTSITSGWFREYAWKNYDKVMELYHESFVKKFTEALEAGKIAPYVKSY